MRHSLLVSLLIMTLISPAIAQYSGPNDESADAWTQEPESSQTEEQKTRSNLSEKARQRRMESANERAPTRRQVHLAFGPAYFNNLNTGSTGFDITAGYNWIIDDQWELGLRSQFAISTEAIRAYSISGLITTNYYFLQEDISPFVGAGFGYGWAKARSTGIDDSTAGGFALSAQAGVKFFRASDVNMAVSGVYTTIFDQNSLGQPGIFGLQVGIFF